MNCKLILALALIFSARAASSQQSYTLLNENRAPLRKNAYNEIPIGAIKPEGWLLEMLLRQKTGATGNLDSLYPLVMNKRNIK